MRKLSFVIVILTLAFVACGVVFISYSHAAPPLAPTDLHASLSLCSGGDTRSVHLSWTPPSGPVDAYAIYHDGLMSGWRYAFLVEDPVFDYAQTHVFELTPDASHTFNVSAINPDGESPWSAGVTIYLTACPLAKDPTPPQNFQAMALAPDVVLTVWQAPTYNGKNCHIYRQEYCRDTTIFGYQVYRTYADAADGYPGPSKLGEYASLVGATFVMGCGPSQVPEQFLYDMPGNWLPKSQVPLEPDTNYLYAARVWNCGGQISELTTPLLLTTPPTP